MCPTKGGKWTESVFSYDILGLEVGKGKCNEREWLRMDVGQCFYSSASDGKHDFYRQTYYPFITPMKSLCSMGFVLLYLLCLHFNLFPSLLTISAPSGPAEQNIVCVHPWYPGNSKSCVGECSGV